VQDFCSFSTTAWTDICSCNICIHHIHVDYAGSRRAMQEELPKRKKMGIAGYVILFTTQTMGKKTSKLGIFFAGNRLNPSA
jgi:hypothetical protein